MTLESALTAYGYPILYLGTILEGETFVLISAILCQTGHLKVIWVICTAFLGALSGDLLCFQAGRFGGETFLKKKLYWQRRSVKAYRLLQRHQNLIVVSYRFFCGFRAVIPFLIGMSDFSFRRFFWLSSAGAMVWSATITGAGFVLGKVVLLFLEDIQHYQVWFFIGLLVLGIVLWAVYRFKHRKQRSKERCQKAEDRCQKSEDGVQMTEIG